MTSTRRASKDDGWLVLADGTRFQGKVFGAPRTGIGEAVFTTGMTGYQEVLTDPSYCGQLVTMTAPHIGNTGINGSDLETETPQVGGFMIHEASPRVSNWRSSEDLDAYLRRSNVPAIAGVDTRTLTRHLRDNGAQCAAFGADDPENLHEQAKAAPPMAGQNLTLQVSCKEPHPWTEGLGTQWDGRNKRPAHGLRVVAVDYGVKRNILRCLVDAGFQVTVVPCTTSAEDILKLESDAIFLSNGPGDPAAVTEGVKTVQALLGKKPLFAICLGHQILSQALGAKTFKLKFGHRGLNQPVRDLETGRIEITSQNHGFAVDIPSMEGKCTLTHVHLNDGTCQGLENKEAKAFSVQYHPEASAGPHDSRYLFDRFAERVQSWS